MTKSMTENKGLLGCGWKMVVRNKRYIFWFWLLNWTLAEFGTSAFRNQAHSILDHSLYADRLVHGFDLSVFTEMLARAEFGSTRAATMPAVCFAMLFAVATALFLPGVFQGYASNYRLPREDFFRACGRNLWRFIRLMVIAGMVMGIVAGVLFGINAAIVKKAGESTNEVLPIGLRMTGLVVIFLVMTALRIWFDLAETDVVLDDQRAVRKSIASAFRHTLLGLIRLLGSYVVTAIVAAIILVGGLWCWLHFVPSDSVIGAFLIGQVTLLLLLVPRFWQRGVSVSYWQQKMLVPVAAAEPFIPQPIVTDPVPVALTPEAPPPPSDPPPSSDAK
jgi:hypothetical protein